MDYRLIIFVLTVILCAGVSANSTYAAEGGFATTQSGYEGVVEPKLTNTSVIVDDDERPPLEPNIAPTRFLKYPPVISLRERVDRLVYGISTDISPEYDHYGYEIRRYMSTVGNLKIFEDPEYLTEQIKNARKASVIAEYWKKSISKDIQEIQEIMDTDSSVDLRVRTAFKQNKVTAQTFLISLKSWIDANERVLLVVHKNSNIYEVEYPEILIVIPATRIEFYNLYATKQAKLKDIQQYQPFALMVY